LQLCTGPEANVSVIDPGRKRALPTSGGFNKVRALPAAPVKTAIAKRHPFGVEPAQKGRRSFSSWFGWW
jgi:hypothetical protein